MKSPVCNNSSAGLKVENNQRDIPAYHLIGNRLIKSTELLLDVWNYSLVFLKNDCVGKSQPEKTKRATTKKNLIPSEYEKERRDRTWEFSSWISGKNTVCFKHDGYGQMYIF